MPAIILHTDRQEIVVQGWTSCLMLQVNVQQVWLSFSSGVLAFVFIFGNNIRNIYESCLLLFVVHPFDVGDVLFLDKDQWCQVRCSRCLKCSILSAHNKAAGNFYLLMRHKHCDSVHACSLQVVAEPSSLAFEEVVFLRFEPSCPSFTHRESDV